MRCLVTGAADGIGRALLEALAERGDRVVGLDRDADRADAVRAPGAEMHVVDLTDDGARPGLLDRLAGGEEGPFDLIAHNAGISHVGPFEATDLDAQRAVVDLNLRAPIVWTRDLLRRGLVGERATFVFVSSLSHHVGYPGAAVYAATKDGLTSFARSLAASLAPEQHVLTVFPGPVRTAHARRYAPPGSGEERRMPPAELARRILRAVDRRRSTLVPGTGNRIAALLGRTAPGLTARLLRRALYDRLRANSG